MDYNPLILFLAGTIITFIITVLSVRKLIPILKSKKMGQKILDIGPRWHKSKEGTPVMGGISFIIGTTVTAVLGCIFISLRVGTEQAVPVIITVGYAILNGLIGCIDDMAKLKKKQNEGLTAKQKFLLQLIAAALFILALKFTQILNTSLYIPYADIEIQFGYFYYIFALLLLTGIVNSVNLTDGIDGLSSSVTLVVGGFFAVVVFFSGITSNVLPLSLVSSFLMGGTLGFLMYNFYPAKIFMGDTGSLFLGALVVGGAFILGNPLLVVIYGIIYIMETLSVMIQVTYFKLTNGKRIFKMAPIHHHFEKCGWSEIKIVSVFTALTAAACLAAWFGLQ